MIKLSGAHDIEIIETGLRPGEKLFEELLIKSDTLTKTDNDLIFIEKAKTKQLEKKVADLLGVNRAVCLNSQTACAEMTLRLLGVGPGDEVITSAYTYTASASVVCHVGAKLVLIDTQEDSLEMDYEKLENAITENTKVIIPVDLAGVPCDYDRIFSIVEITNAIRKIIKSYNLKDKGNHSC